MHRWVSPNSVNLIKFSKYFATWPLDPRDSYYQNKSTELYQTCFFGLLFYTVDIPKGFSNAVSSWGRWSSTNNERKQVVVTTERGGEGTWLIENQCRYL